MYWGIQGWGKKGVSILTAFIDFKQAHDRVDRDIGVSGKNGAEWQCTCLEGSIYGGTVKQIQAGKKVW